MRVAVGARELLDTVLDDGSFQSWDEPPAALPPSLDSPSYRTELVEAAARSGVDEAVLTGEGRIGGRRVAVLCGEFRFLAGSIGVTAAERLLRAIERAGRLRLPLLAATASGGTRMQEGSLAFLRMAAISSALTAHKAAGLPYLVYLGHPTTGGVFASWGSLGHLTVAEPGALIGFLGPRVYSALHGEPFPEGVQTAENLHAHGLLDAVLPARRLADVAGRVLDILTPAPTNTSTASRGDLHGESGKTPRHVGENSTRVGENPVADGDLAEQGGVTTEGWEEPAASVPHAWESITATRRTDRPGVRDLLRLAARDAVPLSGTGFGETGRGILLALARFGTTGCVVVGQDRATQARVPLGPGALRAAQRGMRLSAELGLPLVTVIDTPGAELSVHAEQGGLAGEIAHCLADLGALPSVTLSVLLGQGTGGAALALLPTDRVIAARHGWLAPLAPEGAATIVHGSPERAAELAEAQHVTAEELHRAGAVDEIVEESPDAAAEPAEFSRRMAAAIERHLGELAAFSPEQRLTHRRDRYRHL
jgi:acyl-CoA carboxylase subunit beta